MNPQDPDREKLIKHAMVARQAFRNYYQDPENGPFDGGQEDWCYAEEERVVDAVLAVLQQDKTTEDQVVSAEGSPAVDPANERPGTPLARWRAMVDQICQREAILLDLVGWSMVSPRAPEGALLRAFDKLVAERAAGSMAHASEPERRKGEISADCLDQARRALDRGMANGLIAETPELHEFSRWAIRTAGSMAEPSEPTPAETTESSEVSPQSSSGSCGPGGEGERE